MNCILGLFDVLGFTGFCENCDFLNAEKVLKIMDDFDVEQPKMVMSELDPDNQCPKEKAQTLTSQLKWVIFSDTVFVAMPVDQSIHPDDLETYLIFFTLTVKYINRRMFEIGLPVRGAVHIGNVLIFCRALLGLRSGSLRL
jgi:hypothetical protein